MNGDSRGVVILGGGLAGLTAALYSGAPVYEAASASGGVAASDACNGFTFDRGIHILQTRNPIVLDLLRDLGVELINHQRQAYIYSRGKYTAYPFQVNTAGLPIGLRFRCVRDFLRRHRHPEPQNYEQWMYRSIGTSFAETFLIPYSTKFWGVHPREMSFDWVGNRVPQPSTMQVLRGALWSRQTRIGTNVDFRYPVMGAGYGAIAKALETRVGELYLDHRAVHLDPRRRRVAFQNGTAVEYETLIASIPLPELIRICPDAPATVREAAGRLRTNSILVVNLGLERADLPKRHWVHFPEPDISFFRISFPHLFAPDVAPPGTSAISAEVAFSADRPPDREATIDRVIADLTRVGVLRDNERFLVRFATTIRYGYCIYDRHRRAAVRTIHEWLRTVGIVPTGRYGLWTYFWSDESMLSGKKAAEKALKRVNGRATRPRAVSS